LRNIKFIFKIRTGVLALITSLRAGITNLFVLFVFIRVGIGVCYLFLK